MTTSPQGAHISAPSIKVPPVRVAFEESDRKWIFEQLEEVLSGGMVAAGKKVDEFEAFWAEYTGCRHAVSVANGGAALNAIMAGLDIGGKDVLVPTNTFIATANAVIFSQGNPVYLDTDRRTMAVTLEEIQKKYTSNTAGVVIVHIGGIITPEIEAIATWCKEKNIWLVEDAAHAHGSEYNDKRAGQFGVAAAYSFFATKTMTAGEGGMVVTQDDKLADFCRSYRDYGKKSQWESVHSIVSPNARISDITAVIGLNQSHRLDEFIASRTSVSERYTAGFSDTLEVVLPEGRCSWYKYIALLPKGIDRDDFKAQLRERGVSLAGNVYDLPLHLQPVFEHLNLKGTLPISEEICDRQFCPPIFFGMTDEQVNHVITNVNDLIATMGSD